MLSVFLSFILPGFFFSAAANSSSAANHFNLTAIAAKNGQSLFQCWQLIDPLTVSTTAGIAGAAIQQLGSLGAGEYGWLPAYFPGTPHPAPEPQYVIFLSGQVEISIPGSSEKDLFIAGQHSLLFADDTANKSKLGHVSTILDQNSEFVTIPTANGTAPPHRVLYEGVCRPSELRL